VGAVGEPLLQFWTRTWWHLDCVDLHHGHGVRLPAAFITTGPPGKMRR
jgi:hypothetical protein